MRYASLVPFILSILLLHSLYYALLLYSTLTISILPLHLLSSPSLAAPAISRFPSSLHYTLTPAPTRTHSRTQRGCTTRDHIISETTQQCTLSVEKHSAFTGDKRPTTTAIAAATSMATEALVTFTAIAVMAWLAHRGASA
jgi:hypothetical protein